MLKKVNWLIEKNVIEGEKQFFAELTKQGYIHKETTYLNFPPGAANKYFANDECVLFKGTLNQAN